ncbi:hypothetical protein J6590_010758 [Homalodisca vitripennis]|nr:hypothetical protein J6590_010758 [Homalodisca vitripennis]
MEINPGSKVLTFSDGSTSNISIRKYRPGRQRVGYYERGYCHHRRPIGGEGDALKHGPYQGKTGGGRSRPTLITCRITGIVEESLVWSSFHSLDVSEETGRQAVVGKTNFYTQIKLCQSTE